MLLQAIDQIRQVLDLLEALHEFRLVQRMVAVLERPRTVIFDEVHAESEMLDPHELDHIVHVLEKIIQGRILLRHPLRQR